MPRRAPLNIIVFGGGPLAASQRLTRPHTQGTVSRYSSLRASWATLARGTQVSPNAMRLLLRLSLGPGLRARTVESTGIAFRRYDTGVRVGYIRWVSRMARDHGAPYYHIYRADTKRYSIASRALLPACVSAPAYPFAPSSPTLPLWEVRASRSYVAKCSMRDLVVGADGVKSTLQKAGTGLDDRPTPTGDAAYLAVVCTDLMLEDPELGLFVKTPKMTACQRMAPGHHLIAYCIVSRQVVAPFIFGNRHLRNVCVGYQRAEKGYNLVLLHPDDGSVESCTEEGSGDKMRADLRTLNVFEPRVP
jgi:salicylate hydroxylase